MKKIEKQQLMKSIQPKQFKDVSNLTQLLDGLTISKERNLLVEVTNITHSNRKM